MSYATYKFLHIVAIILVFITLGGLTALSAKPISKRLYVIINGICLVLVFFAGFGLLHKLNVPWPWPVWVWVKLLGWLFIGMGPALVKKYSPTIILTLYGVVAVVMVYMVLFKPF